jgi:hypothetical protein
MPSTNTRQRAEGQPPAPGQSSAARRCRRKFLHYFPGGFRDETYLAWERDYKWNAHKRWLESLGRDEFGRLLRARDYAEIASRAVRIEARTNLIFSFEKMALRDALRGDGAGDFAKALFKLLHGGGPAPTAFDAWTNALAALPHEGSRVFTWPVATVFGFLAQPARHIFIKPNVMKRAAEAYGHPFDYQSRPAWPTYSSALQLAAHVRADLRDLGPRDMIDIQSFLWVLGSDEYPD